MTPVEYHEGTKHRFDAFARSLGHMDWASQPSLFRHFDGALTLSLYPDPAVVAASSTTPSYVSAGPTTYDALFRPPSAHEPIDEFTLGDALRFALGLSAWKQFKTSRWSLRVNPSSGNLHPTEAYVIAGAIPGLPPSPAVYHYLPERHGLERRAEFPADGWDAFSGGAEGLLVALTSIHWREAWKYGERAFRYCQHDLGHAIACLRMSAARFGWTVRIDPRWSHAQMTTLLGLDRAADFHEAEPEEPGCVLLVTRHSTSSAHAWQPHERLIDAVRGGTWHGRASQLSVDHVEWSFIDDVARATRETGRSAAVETPRPPVTTPPAIDDRMLDPRTLMRQRRSAQAFDGKTSMTREAFVTILQRLMPGPHAPWDAMWWTPRIHLALFVHRVDDVAPGLYLLPRDPAAAPRLHAALRPELGWEPLQDDLPLVCLATSDCRALSRRLSCDQPIAADGCFSLGMLADFDASLAEFGPAFYRHLFWESGIVGQVLYLEAEAAGMRGTGIGCFYDDPVHDLLGFRDQQFQSLYHFTVGLPLEDRRLMTQPGYGWEPLSTLSRSPRL